MYRFIGLFQGGPPLFDLDCRAEIAALTFDRGLHPEGFIRQSVAMLADGDRTERLRKVRMPTLVLHGESDPLSQPAHGFALGAAVPDATVEVLAEWGHGLDYPALWPALSQYIADFGKIHPVSTY